MFAVFFWSKPSLNHLLSGESVPQSGTRGSEILNNDYVPDAELFRLKMIIK